MKTETKLQEKQPNRPQEKDQHLNCDVFNNQTSSSQGRPAFVFPSFISTFAPPNPMLVSSRASALAAFSAQSGLPTSFAANLAPVLHQPFVARASRRSRQKSSP